MSLIGQAIGFFTGGNKTAESVIDGVKKAGDMLVFTDEEKSINNMKAMELFIKLQEATLPQNVTRRHIAIVVVMLWAVFLVFTLIFKLIGVFSGFDSFTQAAEFTFKMITDNINVPFGIIIGFYYLKRIVQK